MEAKINSLDPFVMLDFVFYLSAMTVSSYVFRSDPMKKNADSKMSASVTVLPLTNK